MHQSEALSPLLLSILETFSFSFFSLAFSLRRSFVRFVGPPFCEEIANLRGYRFGVTVKCRDFYSELVIFCIFRKHNGAANEGVRRQPAPGLEAGGPAEAVRALRRRHRVRHHEPLRLRPHADRGAGVGGDPGAEQQHIQRRRHHGGARSHQGARPARRRSRRRGPRRHARRRRPARRRAHARRGRRPGRAVRAAADARRAAAARAADAQRRRRVRARRPRLRRALRRVRLRRGPARVRDGGPRARPVRGAGDVRRPARVRGGGGRDAADVRGPPRAHVRRARHAGPPRADGRAPGADGGRVRPRRAAPADGQRRHVQQKVTHARRTCRPRRI